MKKNAQFWLSKSCSNTSVKCFCCLCTLMDTIPWRVVATWVYIGLWPTEVNKYLAHVLPFFLMKRHFNICLITEIFYAILLSAIYPLQFLDDPIHLLLVSSSMFTSVFIIICLNINDLSSIILRIRYEMKKSQDYYMLKSAHIVHMHMDLQERLNLLIKIGCLRIASILFNSLMVINAYCLNVMSIMIVGTTTNRFHRLA